MHRASSAVAILLLIVGSLTVLPALSFYGVAAADDSGGYFAQASTAPSGASVRSTPIYHRNGTVSLLPQATQNHWWLIDDWNNYNTYGNFTAAPNTISGLSPDDAVLILPMNLAYGTSANFEWFQFDMQFNPDGSVLFLIWNVPNCGSFSPTYNPYTIGIAYVPGDRYHYQGSIVAGNFVFQIWDDTAGTTWSMDFSVPSTSPFSDYACFSPASAIEGYTSVSSVSNVPSFQFTIGYGMTSFTPVQAGVGVPTGLSIDQSSLGGSPSTWQYGMIGTSSFVTMTVSYSIVGGGSPTPPTLTYYEAGVPNSYVLTTTPTSVLTDPGTSWSVTPNPLLSSKPSERWQSSQTLSGTTSTTTIVFAFYHQYLQTLSYSIVGEGTGYSAPVFTANLFGSSVGQTLTGTATGYWFDDSASWTVTNPLDGSTPSEQWVASQPFSGTVSSAQVLAFSYQHQYYLTTQANPSAGGTVMPSSGWQNADSAVTLAANAAKGYAFSSWNGAGDGSYSGFNDPAKIMISGPITETANFQALLSIQLQAGWNLISLPVVPNSTSITALLRSQIAANEIIAVWAYTGTPRTWQGFVPGKGGALTTMTDGNGYWIDMKTSDTLYINGNVIAPSSTPPTYSLVQGWDLVGFKPQPTVQDESVAQYLSNINGKYDLNSVWVYDNTSQTWTRADSTYMLQPGQAMWILMTSAATLIP